MFFSIIGLIAFFIGVELIRSCIRKAVTDIEEKLDCINNALETIDRNQFLHK